MTIEDAAPSLADRPSVARINALRDRMESAALQWARMKTMGVHQVDDTLIASGSKDEAKALTEYYSWRVFESALALLAELSLTPLPQRPPEAPPS